MSWKRRLSLSVVLTILAISMLPFVSFVPATIAHEQGEPPIPPCEWGQPRFDEIEYSVVRDPIIAVEEMKAGRIDYIKQVPERAMQEELEALGFNLSYCEVCELCGFWFNCRDYVPPYGDGPLHNPGDPLQPLNYSDFRTAVHYMFGYDRKDYWKGTIYGPTMLPLDVVVPYAQAEWCAANDPVPCYPGAYLGGPNNPFPTHPALACQILEDCGFTVEDSDADTKMELHNPDGTIVRQITVWYKAGDPLLQQFVHAWITEVNNHFRDDCGVEEGPDDLVCGGLVYPFTPVAVGCDWMMMHMLYLHDFDVVYWCFETWLQCPLGRFPDWLYHLFHSQFTGHKDYNFMGFVNATSDDLTETIFTSLDRDQILCAAYWFQYYMLYEWNAVIPTDTKYAVSAYGRGGGAGGACTRWLEDWTAIPSCCSDNHYTWCQMHWRDNPTGECDHIVRHLSQPPAELHPWYSNTQSEWAFLDREYEGLIDIHPQTLEDEPFIACDWNVTYGDWHALGIENGMRVTFWLKNEVFWKDGYKVVAEDVKANWDYLKKYQVPRYHPMWKHLVYTECEGPYKVTAYLNTTSLWLLYHLAKTALFFPKWVLHNLDKAIDDPADPWGIIDPQDFRPTDICYCEFADYCGVEYGPWIDPTTCIPMCIPDYDPGTGTSPKWEGGCYKMLIGTGQYYFDYYDPETEKGHMVKNTCYWAGESELFCNIDASGDPDRPTGMELAERDLYKQEANSSAIFEIQVRNLCGHEIKDLYVAASLDGYIFETEGPFILDPWTHICVPFESPVVDCCQHELDQKIFIGKPIPVCEPYPLEPCQEVWFEPCTYVHWIEPGLVHIEQPTYIHVVEGEALVDGEPIPICEPYPLYPCQLVWFAPSTIVHWPTTPGHMHIEEPTVIHVQEGTAYTVTICCVGDKYVWWTIKEDITGTSITDIRELLTIPVVTARQTPLPDCKVDIRDVITPAVAFRAYPGHPRWNSVADVDGDYLITIIDVGCIAKVFGWYCGGVPTPELPEPQPYQVYLVADTALCGGACLRKTVVCCNYNLSVYIKILNVTNLFAYDIVLDYNATTLELVAWELMAPWGVPQVFPIEGYIAITGLGPGLSFNGSATIAKLIFTAKIVGNATLDPSRSVLATGCRVTNIPFIPVSARVRISKTGDVTGGTANPLDYVPDGKVDMKDVATVARACWADRVTDPESPKYGEYWHAPDIIPPCNMCPHSPNCDVNDDGKIDTQDVAITSRHAID